MTPLERSDAELSREVACEAGRLLLDVRRSFGELDIDDRDRRRELRDTADREAHLLIARRLADARPEDTVLSEEGDEDASRLTADRLWIVDPLDGTWEYGQSRSDFAVHIALWSRGKAGGALSAATVDLPAQGMTYSVLDAAPEATAVPRERPVRVVVSRSRRPAGLDDVVRRLERRLDADGYGRLGVEVVQVGSVGAKAAELFAGRAEIYLHDSGFHDWDLAAPLGVARHRGLWCAAPDGRAFTFDSESTMQPGVIMAVPSLAELAREVILG